MHAYSARIQIYPLDHACRNIFYHCHCIPACARARSAIFDLYRSSVNSEIGRPTRLANFARSIDFILLKNGPEIHSPHVKDTWHYSGRLAWILV